MPKFPVGPASGDHSLPCRGPVRIEMLCLIHNLCCCSDPNGVPAPSARSVVLRQLQVLPYLGLIVGFITILTPYTLAVIRGDVPAWLPYISDAGGDPPQSSIFSMGLTVIGLLCE